MTVVDELVEIYATKGRETFEGDRRVTQTSHGLQTAMIAEQEGQGLGRPPEGIGSQMVRKNRLLWWPRNVPVR